MPEWPDVTIGIPTCSGSRWLRTALPSLRSLDYPAERIEILIHDNASTEPVEPWVREAHPGASVVRSERNLGFAVACNEIAAAAASPLVCFVNDDMSFDEAFLRELVLARHQTEAACVGAVVRSADGGGLEFAGGSLAFTGHGAPAADGAALAASDTLVPSLFVSGGAMLVDRDTFLDCEGFAPEYFAWYEDVDFGWRLHALGGHAVVAPRAVCFHEGHGSESQLGPDGRMRLLERNALLSVLRNFEDSLLEAVFPYALALSALRAELEPARAAACEQGRLAAMALLPRAERARRQLAERRIVSSEALLPLFREPFRVEISGERYADGQRALAEAYGLRAFVAGCGAAA